MIMTKRGICFLILCLTIVFGLHVEAYAEKKTDTVFFDESANQISYGERVANLNRQAEDNRKDETGKKKGEIAEKELFAVLCRSDGRNIDFSQWNPVYVVAGPRNRYTLFFDMEAVADKATESLKDVPGICYAERDAEVQACGDTDFLSWGAVNMNYGPFHTYALPLCQSSVTVAIIDSGVFMHTMYQDRIKESGYDYVDADHDATNDLYGHGTNVAGILADCTAGFPVFFYPIRVLNASGGGSISNVTNAVCEATERQVDIINLSLSSKTISEALDEAVIDAIDAGITVVIAAGNQSMDTAQISPAHLTDPGILVVGSAESDGNMASYSNFGESVDLYAYGTNIVCCSRSGGYTTATGTSMAAPHISGLSAILRLTHTEICPEELELRILCATDLTETVNVPDLKRIIPEKAGFYLLDLRMDLDDRIQLPIDVRPVTAMERLLITSSDPEILSVENGCLIPRKSGTAQIVVNCPGIEEFAFTVNIVDEACICLNVPKGIKAIEQEAFSGNQGISHLVFQEGLEILGMQAFDNCVNLRTVEIPKSVETIEENTFSGAVVLCEEGSIAEEYMVTNKFQYILKKDKSE